MKGHWKTILIAALVCIVLGVLFWLSPWSKPEYVALGGDVAVVGKAMHGDTPYLIVDSSYDYDETSGAWKWNGKGNASSFLPLSCTQEQYQALDVGDVIFCTYSVSHSLHTGRLEKVESVLYKSSE